MYSALMGLLAETSIHPGEGRSTGIVDLPVAREAATDYPVLPGSSLKGALRSHCRAVRGELQSRLFGEQNEAGALLISDARLLLLPVRSLTGAYKWVTCPHLLERFFRDVRRAGLPALAEAPQVSAGKAHGTGSGALYLEEREFVVTDPVSDQLIETIAGVILHETTRGRLRDQLVVLNDDDFSWFARYGLAIQARNVLEKDTKRSKNIWYEESLPADTVMYALIAARARAELESFQELFPDDRPYLQAGGNETVGHGWFAVTLRTAAKGGAA